jgi:hypothetical protein
MAHDQFLQNLINDCIESIDDNEKDRFVGWESLFSILVYQGLLIMLPELKEWLKLAASAIALKRQEVKKKLIEFAAEKELDFPQAETAADKVADRLDENTIKQVVKALEAKAT